MKPQHRHLIIAVFDRKQCWGFTPTYRAQVVATTSMRVTTALATKAGELKVAAMTSPAALTAMKHMDKIADTIDGFLNPGPPPMSPAGVIAGMVASPESVITVDEIDDR